jgi:thiamine-monophosphate kinase
MDRQSRLPLGPGAEFDLIRRFLPHAPRLGRDDVHVGPGDDCAVVVGSGGIAISVDMSVEGVHFRRDWLEAHQIGCRAASAALSDLAAVAARPIGVLVSLAVAESDADDMAVALMDGARNAVERVGGVILGGDLTRSSGPVVLDFTVVGECREAVLRSGAQAGDEIWVTGELGAAAISIARLLRQETPHPDAWDRFSCPMPRVPEAIWLHDRRLARAMIDLSDGLAGDAAHLASASGVAVVLDFAALPIHPAVRADTAAEEDAIRYAMAGGEDYELCFAAAPGTVTPLVPEFEQEFGTRLTRVGWVEEGSGVFRATAEGERQPLGLAGFQHFGDGA